MSLSEAGAKLLEWRERPRQFVEEVFGVVPDAWQTEVLDAFPQRERIAMKACKGPGKTAVEAWLLWNFMVTRPRPTARSGTTDATAATPSVYAGIAASLYELRRRGPGFGTRDSFRAWLLEPGAPGPYVSSSSMFQYR